MSARAAQTLDGPARVAGLVGTREGARIAAAGASPVGPARVTIEAPRAWFSGPADGVVEAEGLLVALDGRIYNADEIDGADGDARAVARLVRRHGMAGALRLLNGDLALAVCDPATGTLWLARDRVGLRPLYYAVMPDLVGFASRPRALFRVSGLEACPDPDFVARFAGAHYRAIDSDPAGSPYVGVRQVPPGTVLTIANGRVRSERYWDPTEAPAPRSDVQELAEQYRDLLLDAVRRRLGAVPRAAFTLSGGMDSSSVLACAVRVTGTRQHAFSTVYEDATYDESAEIASMRNTAVERWHRVRIGTPDVFELVRRMVAVHDEPIATATWLSHYLLVESAAEERFGALFGGLGGDELNAGEYEYFPFHFADLRSQGRESELAHEIACWARYHDHPVFRKGPAQAELAMGRLTDPRRPGRCLPDRERLLRYASALAPEFAARLRAFSPVMEHPFPTCLANRAWQDLTRETLPCCLRAGDRNAAAFGLERVEPFLDHRLIELMFQVPGDLKIRDGVTKRLLREATRGVLPEETRSRVAKTGWNAPAHRWFSGPGREVVLDLVRSRAFRERGIYDQREVERLVGEHDEIVSMGVPRENHMMFLWQLVNVELWLQDVDVERGRRGDGTAGRTALV